MGKQLARPSGILGRITGKLMDHRNYKAYEEIMKDLELTNGDRLFEIGYGTGMGLGLILKKPIDCKIGGIDYSEVMYRTAMKRNEDYIKANRLILNYGDFINSEVDNGAYNKVYCVNVIYFWEDLLSVFCKIHSILPDQGRFCIYMTPAEYFEKMKFAENFKKYSIDIVKAKLTEAGFSSVEHRKTTDYYIKAIK